MERDRTFVLEIPYDLMYSKNRTNVLIKERRVLQMKQEEKYLEMIVKLLKRHKSKIREAYYLLLGFLEG